MAIVWWYVTDIHELEELPGYPAHEHLPGQEELPHGLVVDLCAQLEEQGQLVQQLGVEGSVGRAGRLQLLSQLGVDSALMRGHNKIKCYAVDKLTT